MNRRHILGPVVVLAGCLPLLASCGSGGFSGLYGAPLPGGADLGGHPYTVVADFTDVLDLVPQASVEVNDVPVGKVTRIDLAADNRTAEVTMAVNANVRLPANSGADLRQSSLLGEKYVELVAPDAAPTGTLANGAVIPLSRTNRNTDLEEVLGALSLLLNGGDIGQIKNIVGELNNALAGNEPALRSLLSRVDSLTQNLDGQRTNITNAIDALNRLSATVNAQRGDLADALRELGPGLQVVNQQREQLVDLLRSMDNLSGVMVDTVNRSRDQVVADLRQLAPTVEALAQAGDNLPKSLQMLVTFPFTDYAVNDVKGDYFNVDVNVNLDLTSVLSDLANASTTPVDLRSVTGTGQSAPSGPTAPLPLPGSGPPAGSGVFGLLNSLLGGGS